MNIFQSVRHWMITAGQLPAVQTAPDVRRVAFQIGMQLEELAEKMDAVFGYRSDLAETMHSVADCLKRGDYDGHVCGALADPKGAEALLDGDIDLLWVTAGSIAASAADGEGAWKAVDAANWAKFPGGIATLHPETGKVIKPKGWQAPDLSKFVHGGQR